MASDELKPCPFCGEEAEIERIGTARFSTIYSCTFCGCTLETGETFNHGARWNERAQDFDAMRQRAEKAELALKELRSMFPVKLDKQAFVVNGGEPLRADADDEFYSAAKVNRVLSELLECVDAALAQQAKP